MISPESHTSFPRGSSAMANERCPPGATESSRRPPSCSRATSASVRVPAAKCHSIVRQMAASSVPLENSDTFYHVRGWTSPRFDSSQATGVAKPQTAEIQLCFDPCSPPANRTALTQSECGCCAPGRRSEPNVHRRSCRDDAHVFTNRSNQSVHRSGRAIARDAARDCGNHRQCRSRIHRRPRHSARHQRRPWYSRLDASASVHRGGCERPLSISARGLRSVRSVGTLGTHAPPLPSRSRQPSPRRPDHPLVLGLLEL